MSGRSIFTVTLHTPSVPFRIGHVPSINCPESSTREAEGALTEKVTSPPVSTRGDTIGLFHGFPCATTEVDQPTAKHKIIMLKNLIILSSYLGKTRKTTAGYKQETPSGCLFPSFIGLLSSDRRYKESLLSWSASSQVSQTSLLPAILYHRHIPAIPYRKPTSAG